MLARKIEISHRTIVFTVVFLIALWLLYLIRDILLQFFVSLLIMTILNPFVSRLAEYKIPRSVSILLVYLLVLILVSISVAGVVPPLIDQSTTLVNRIPYLVEQVGAFGVFGERLLNEVISLVGSLPASAAKFSVSVFSNVINLAAVLVFTFYLLLSRDKLESNMGVYFSKQRQESIERILDLLEEKLGGWLRGQVALMALVGVATYIGLLILNIPFALPLAILAGLLEIIPYLGPFASAVPAVLIGLGISPVIGLAVVALYFLIQQLENYIFVPKVMERSVGVSPIVTLLALAIGFRLAGITGVVISVPVVVVLQVLVDEFMLNYKKQS